MSTRIEFAVVSVLVYLFAGCGEAKQNQNTKTIGPLQVKSDGRWVESNAAKIKKKLDDGESLEVRLRGWTVPISSIGDQPTWLLDVGETTWALHFGDDDKLYGSAKNLEGQRIVVTGKASQEMIGFVSQTSISVVEVESIVPAKPEQTPTYINELEGQVAKLIHRIKLMEKLQNEREIEIRLPPASEAVPLTVNPEEIFINIGKDGTLFVDKKRVTAKELESMLERAAVNNPVAQEVIVRADGRVAYQHVAMVTDICNKFDIRHVSVSIVRSE